MQLRTIIFLVPMALGAFITVVNFYLSFLRYPLHRYRGGSRENYRWMSGIPLFGSALLWLGAAGMSDFPMLRWGAILLSMLDTGGVHYFALALLVDRFRR